MLPVASAGGDHAERDRQREVPRRDDDGDAARRVAQLVALARHLEQLHARARARPRRARRTRGSRPPRRGRRRPPATACPPRAGSATPRAAGGRAGSGPRAGGSRRAPRPASGSTRGRRARRPPARGRPRPAWPTRRAATTRSGFDGSVETSSSPSRRSSPIHTGTRTRQLGVERRERVGELRAHGRAPQLEDRLVAERRLMRPCRSGPAAPAAGRGRRRACCGEQERVVGRVLEQAPHEVGHARDEVADRAVGAHAQALLGDRLLQRVAEPAQDLQLEVGVVAAGDPVVGDRVRDGADVVRGDRDPHRDALARARRAAAA